jgi:hypothetical protein
MFETPTNVEKPMKIDQHPFQTNVVEVYSKDTLGTCVVRGLVDGHFMV